MHAEAWSSLPNVEVTRVVDVDWTKGLRLAERYGAAFTPSLEDALEETDVVSICTPSHLHAEQTILAARAESDVLVEKPTATTQEGYDRVKEAVRTTGRCVVPAAAGRLYPEVKRAKAWLKEGRIGEPKWLVEFCRLDCSWLPEWYFDRSRSGGGILIAAGTHSVDRSLWLMDARSVEVIRAEIRRYEVPGETEDYAKAYLYLDGTLPVSTEFVWARDIKENHRIDVVGSQGTLRILVSQGIVADTRAGSESWFPYWSGMTHSQKAVVGIRAVAETLLAAHHWGTVPVSTLDDDHRTFKVIQSIYGATSSPHDSM